MRLRKGEWQKVNDRPAARGTAPATAPGLAVELRGVQRQYDRGTGTARALAGVDLGLSQGTFTAIMGPSGSGTSTFPQCAAGLDRPTSGAVRLGGTEITGMSENKLTELRRSRSRFGFGFGFQAFNLPPSLTVEQNVLLPIRLAGQRQDHCRAEAVLALVGLADKAKRRPGELAGGQQQRVTVTRTLVTAPDVIFADEPTGTLDTGTAAEALGLLRHTVNTLGATVALAIHAPTAAAWADRVLFLADGTFADHLEQGPAEQTAVRVPVLTSRTGAMAGAVA
ncbi:ABC transporter ATP-binding protein [Streptomyces sp. NBC_00236]|uniref:ABC transporter ATP-binding protein n=1 Tax=Streptomyces sp. NBC_00236 TaxID=2903639 RepID=UPI002E2B13B4|nr:ATP-binding cassette domain-containing protein [Streptomyces sp. NBC_00236]